MFVWNVIKEDKGLFFYNESETGLGRYYADYINHWL